MASLLDKRSDDSVAELTNAVDDAVRAGLSVQVVAGAFGGELPPEAARLLADALRDLRDGRAVAVAPYELVIGTEQAAEMLGVSRPWIATILDRGDLPMRRNGSKRRVLLGDLVAFRRAEDRRRAADRDGESTAALAAPLVMGTAREAAVLPTSRSRSSVPPTDWSDSTGPAGGVVELPFHLYWSDDNNRFDLSKRARIRSMYQTVLSEGSADDVRTYLNVPILLDIWDELWLSPAVHASWDRWVEDRRRAAV